jgi:hypothetical protein
MGRIEEEKENNRCTDVLVYITSKINMCKDLMRSSK